MPTKNVICVQNFILLWDRQTDTTTATPPSVCYLIIRLAQRYNTLIPLDSGYKNHTNVTSIFFLYNLNCVILWNVFCNVNSKYRL